jgi:hypothetical protein
VKLAAAVVATLLAAPAAAEPQVFVRVNQTGGVLGGELGAGYSLEAAQAVVAVEGSGERGAYQGATHRLAAAYGIFDWLSVGFDQSIRQQAFDQLRIGMFSPIVRVRLDHLGVPVGGLGVYVQRRIRITGRRPDATVTGALFERDLGPARVEALMGWEHARGDGFTENGLRGEMGVSFKLGEAWRLSGETWGNVHWISTTGARESSFHVGPSIRRRFGVVSVGAQLGLGIEDRVGLFLIDGVALLKVGIGL